MPVSSTAILKLLRSAKNSSGWPSSNVDILIIYFSDVAKVGFLHILTLIMCVTCVAPPSESQIPDPDVTLSDPDNERLSVIRRPSGIRFCLSSALARTYL